MTIKKTTHFTFPVGDKELSQEAYYRALAEAKNGFYPFGENGIWHGGIHVDQGVLREIGSDGEKIHCMANGEVNAYRINKAYPKVIYEDNPANKVTEDSESVAYFSSGFTLVRHYFVMPKIAGESTTPPSITLYSLYMHQLDWYGYQQKRQNESINYPTYWKLSSGKVSDKSKDKIEGTIIRQNGAKTTGVGLLLKESKIKLGDKLNKTSWYKLDSLVEGRIVNAKGKYYTDLTAINGYVYGPKVGPIEKDEQAHKNKIYTVTKENNNKLDSPEVTVPGIIVYADSSAKTILAYLPIGTSFDFDGQENGYAKIKKIKDSYVPSSLVKSDSQTEMSHQGWVNIANLTELEYEPHQFDKVVMLDKPQAINNGDFIGYMGDNVSLSAQFQQKKDPSLATDLRPSRDQLSAKASSLQGHFELFTCDDLSDFITQTRALADKLPESEKTLILVEKDAQLVGETPSDEPILSGCHIKLSGDTTQSCYVQASVYYELRLKRYQCFPENIIHPPRLSTDTGSYLAEPAIMQYRLSVEDKASLVNRYHFDYPELTLATIPDRVDVVNADMLSTLVNPLPAGNLQQGYLDDINIRFSLVGDTPYWVGAFV